MMSTLCAAEVLLVLACLAVVESIAIPTGQPTGQRTYLPCVSGSDYTGNLFTLIGVSMAVIVLELTVFTFLRTGGVFYKYVKVLSDSSYSNIRNLDHYKSKRRRETTIRSHTQSDYKHNNCCCRCCRCCSVEWPDEPYGAHYFALLAYKSTFMCCSDIWLPGGRILMHRFPRGFIEDFLLYVANNHSILSLFMCVRGHPFNTSERMLGCFVHNSVVFFQTCLVSYIGGGYYEYLLKLIIAPLSLMWRKIFYLIMACQCIAEHEKEGHIYAHALACLGRFLAFIFFLVSLAIIIAGAVLGATAYEYCSTDSLYEPVGQSALTFLVVSGIIDFLLCGLRFLNGRIAIEVTFCCCFAYKGLGRWFGERIIFFGLKKGVDYDETVFNVLLLKVVVMREKNDCTDRMNIGEEIVGDDRPTEVTVKDSERDLITTNIIVGRGNMLEYSKINQVMPLATEDANSLAPAAVTVPTLSAESWATDVPVDRSHPSLTLVRVVPLHESVCHSDAGAVAVVDVADVLNLRAAENTSSESMVRQLG